MNIYDEVLEALHKHEDLRNSDRSLMWHIWKNQGLIHGGLIDQYDFLKRAVSPESITRAARKVRENFPELQGCEEVVEGRREKEEQRGTFIYRETLF